MVSLGGLIRLKVGIKGITFDAAHYTLDGGKCESLHGHTFELEVIVERKIDETTGMVMDFRELKKAIKEVISEYDHKFIIPSRHLIDIELKGPFKTELKPIPYPHATTEYIALSILNELKRKIEGKIQLRLYEGRESFAEVSSDEQ
jgi:6-pyruvoyltetrahydropterin/6-carboxytetrahydropterin synthase